MKLRQILIMKSIRVKVKVSSKKICPVCGYDGSMGW